MMLLQIVSAWYGPCVERRRDSLPSSTSVTAITYLIDESVGTTAASRANTRDVTCFVRALVLLQHQRTGDIDHRQHHQQQQHLSHRYYEYHHLKKLKKQKHPQQQEEATLAHPSTLPLKTGDDALLEHFHVKNQPDDKKDHDNNSNSNTLIRVDDFRTSSGMKRTVIPLLDGKSMNEAFGDPCPGTSKRLQIHYQVFELSLPKSHPDGNNNNGCNEKRKKLRLVQEYHESFAEHERIVLRLPAAATTTTISWDDNDDGIVRDKAALTVQTNAAVMTLHGYALPQQQQNLQLQQFNEATAGITPSDSGSRQLLQQQLDAWRQRLPMNVWEIVLPMILPFLDIRERVNGRLVNRLWQNVVRDRGVAQSIDWTDRGNFPTTFTCAMLRGLLRQSYFSLTSLYLANFHELTHEDLAPAIPHWRRLRSLDVSGCRQLNNSTLQLLAQHISGTLQVLYLKSLDKVTDQGIVTICQSCHQLRVLDISNLYQLTDAGAGMAIGENLHQLRALYLRDNYLLTNQSLDIITEKCNHLTQLTLWGCIKLEHLSFEQQHQQYGQARCGNLVVLNLWGCHNLRDDAAQSLGRIKQLRSLIVSECHRLTDQFLIGLTQNTPQLNHLHLRYCKKVTDNGVHAIAVSMNNLHSLDLSFCSRIHMESIVALLEMRQNTLSELRLQCCHQLSMVQQSNSSALEAGREGQDGRKLLDALRECNSCLNLLDVRRCGGQPNINQPYPSNDPFVQGMETQQFQQKVPGFFSRPASWDSTVQLRLCDLLMTETPQELDDT